MPSGRLDSKKNLLPPLREKFVLDIPFHRTAEGRVSVGCRPLTRALATLSPQTGEEFTNLTIL
jgi:hypothetical protein